MLALLAAAAVASTAPVAPEEVRLWPGAAPGSEGKSGAETVMVDNLGVHRVATIHKPSLLVYLPPKESATGAAVIVLPGGGHRYLAIDNEGHAVARWLSEHGIAGFVLKYRLAREQGSSYKVDVHALADAQRALRLVRSRAKTWGLDPDRVGVMGFSAGGEVVSLAGARFDGGKAGDKDPIERESSRPAFQILMYSGSSAPEGDQRLDAPPAFFCAASDDRGPTKNAVAAFQKLREAGLSAELHLYARGGHGFGMKDRPLPVTAWPQRLREWLHDQGFLQAKGTP